MLKRARNWTRDGKPLDREDPELEQRLASEFEEVSDPVVLGQDKTARKKLSSKEASTRMRKISKIKCGSTYIAKADSSVADLVEVTEHKEGMVTVRALSGDLPSHFDVQSFSMSEEEFIKSFYLDANGDSVL